MILIDDHEIREQVLEFITLIKIKQEELQKKHKEKVIYTSIPLGYAVKNKILFCSLLTHKLVTKEKFFFEDDITLKEDKDVLECLKQVLEYEITCDLKDALMSSNEINEVIKFKNKLEKKIEKKLLI